MQRVHRGTAEIEGGQASKDGPTLKGWGGRSAAAEGRVLEEEGWIIGGKRFAVGVWGFG